MNEVKTMKMNKLLALLLALVMVLSLAACGGQPATHATDGGNDGGDIAPVAEGEKYIGVHLQAALESIDPAFTSAGDDFEVIGQVVEGLYQVAADGSAQLGMAESVEVSDDGLQMIFHIRDAKWSNGAEVTADDWVYAWQRCFTIPAQYVDLFNTAGIKNAAAIMNGEMDVEELGVHAEDDKTLVVDFDTPCAFFDTLMYFPVFFPVNREFCESCGDLYGSAPEYYLANGPFMITDYSPAATAFTLAKNPDYYDADSVKIDGVNYKVILDEQSAYLAYQSGELDVVILSSEQADMLSQDPEFVSVKSGYLWYISPNINGECSSAKASKALKNVNIRKALSSCFDKNAIVNNILKDGSLLMNSCVPYELCVNSDGVEYRDYSGLEYGIYDVASAQELWKKGMEEIGETELELTMIFDNDATSPNVCAFVKEQAETNLAGLTINLQSLPKKERSDLMKAHTYDLGFCRWGPDYGDPLTYFDLWTDGYTHNYGSWHNDEFMALMNEIKKGETAADNAARWEAFLKCEQIIGDEVVIMPVYQNCNACLVKENVKNVEFHVIGMNRIYKDVVVE